MEGAKHMEAPSKFRENKINNSNLMIQSKNTKFINISREQSDPCKSLATL